MRGNKEIRKFMNWSSKFSEALLQKCAAFFTLQKHTVHCWDRKLGIVVKASIVVKAGICI